MSVRIARSDGQTLPLSERLTAFLSSRADRSLPFFLGDWLGVVQPGVLDEVLASVEAFERGDLSTCVDDLLLLVIVARSAECRSPHHLLDEQRIARWVHTLRGATIIEAYKRFGWVVLDVPLSIVSEVRSSIRLTSEGIKHLGEIG